MTALIDPAVVSRLGVVLEAALILATTLMFLRICDLAVKIERDRRTRRRQLRRDQRLARRLAWQEVDEVTKQSIRSPW